MTQEDKELLLHDLCARLPYGVRINRERIVGSYVSFDFNLSLGTFDKLKVGIQDDELSIKPYLRPMSSMTEEEAKEFDKLMNLVEERCINAYGKGGYTLAFTELNDWLNEHHFDYRGLIEKGLALEAKEGMYKTE